MLKFRSLHVYEQKIESKKSLPRDTNQLNKGAVNSYIVPLSDQERLMQFKMYFRRGCGNASGRSDDRI